MLSINHTYDALEPFRHSKQDCPIQAQVGKAQDSQNFQDVPLIARLSEVVVAAFGKYFKFIVQSELWSWIRCRYMYTLRLLQVIIASSKVILLCGRGKKAARSI